MGRAIFPQRAFEMSEMWSRPTDSMDRRANQAESIGEISVSEVPEGLHGISRDGVCAQTDTTWTSRVVVTRDMQGRNDSEFGERTRDEL